MKRYSIIDLFSGCGGLTEGFEQTGRYYTLACVDWDKSACNTLIKRLKEKWNYPDAKRRVLYFDIQRTEELLKGWKGDDKYGTNPGLNELVPIPPVVDLIIGGPPCQAYSIAGRVRDEHGMRYDYRNYLFESYLKVVDHFKPKAIVFENVPGMLSASPGGVPIVDRVRKGFEDVGYQIIEGLREKALIDFTLFGVPQKRRRVIILGLNQSYFGDNAQVLLNLFYDKILPRYQSKKISTVSEAIGDLPKFYPAEKSFRVHGRNFSHKPHVTEVPNHVPRYHNRRDIQIFKDLANDLLSGEKKFLSTKRLKQLYQERTGKTSNIHKYYVLRWNEPSNTIPAHLYKDGLRHIHPDPEQARSITVREAARLQTFDDDFEFLGSMGAQYKMVGNAVPPLFAKALGHALYDLLEMFENKEMNEIWQKESSTLESYMIKS